MVRSYNIAKQLFSDIKIIHNVPDIYIATDKIGNKKLCINNSYPDGFLIIVIPINDSDVSNILTSKITIMSILKDTKSVNVYKYASDDNLVSSYSMSSEIANDFINFNRISDMIFKHQFNNKLCKSIDSYKTLFLYKQLGPNNRHMILVDLMDNFYLCLNIDGAHPYKYYKFSINYSDITEIENFKIFGDIINKDNDIYKISLSHPYQNHVLNKHKHDLVYDAIKDRTLAVIDNIDIKTH